eukprot:11162872-Lingulodinium_polyedra.AAC.1
MLWGRRAGADAMAKQTGMHRSHADAQLGLGQILARKTCHALATTCRGKSYCWRATMLDWVYL